MSIIEQPKLRKALLGDELYMKCMFPDPSHPVTESDLQRRLLLLRTHHKEFEDCSINQFINMCAFRSSKVKGGCLVNQVKQDQINNTINNDEDKDTVEVCSICTEPETLKHRLVAACRHGHAFHMDCITRQLNIATQPNQEALYKFKCPNCREPLFSRFVTEWRKNKNKEQGMIHPDDRVVVPTTFMDRAKHKLQQGLSSAFDSMSMESLGKKLGSLSAQAHVALFGVPTVDQPRQVEKPEEKQPITEEQMNQQLQQHLEEQLQQARQDLQQQESRIRRREEIVHEETEEIADPRPLQRRKKTPKRPTRQQTQITFQQAEDEGPSREQHEGF